MANKKPKRNRSKQRQKPRSLRLSASDIQKIRHLALIYKEFVPLNSRGKTAWTLTSIAKERGLSKLLPQKNKNKHEAFSTLITNLLKNRKIRTLKMIIRENLAKSIEWRHNKGNPILKEEAENLSMALKDIGIDLSSEINELNFPTERPSIVPPPTEIAQALKSIGIHPKLMPKCEKLFLDGHINDAVRKAAEILESEIQTITGSDKIGQSLMSDTFSIKNPKIKLNRLATQEDKNEQEGFMYITMGVMRWWRNLLSHGNNKTLPHQEALGRLFTISDLLYRTEQRVT